MTLFAALPVCAADSVRVCVGLNPPTPHDVPGKFRGWSFEAFSLLFERLGKNVIYVEDLPWGRCLKMVELQHVDFALGAYYDNERAKSFVFSNRYVSLTPQVFTLTKRNLPMQSTRDLQGKKGCGILGASYEHYGLKSEDLDLGVSTYTALLYKLKNQRCDYFVEELEVARSQKKTGLDILADPEIRAQSIQGAKAPTKHLIAGKGGQGEALMPAINGELEKMAKSGELAKIWKKYERDLPFNR